MRPGGVILYRDGYYLLARKESWRVVVGRLQGIHMNCAARLILVGAGGLRDILVGSFFSQGGGVWDRMVTGTGVNPLWSQAFAGRRVVRGDRWSGGGVVELGVRV